MKTFDLSKIEADVVFVAENPDYGSVYVEPYWECDLPAEDLAGAAAKIGLLFAEKCGGGAVTVQYFDFRV
jgi:hypothetical protein